jgi:membrane protein CcdC involved in cytochrome C biogenesis
MQACLEMCINNVGAKGFVNTYTTVVLSLRARIITKRPLNIVLQQGVFLLKAMPGFFFFIRLLIIQNWKITLQLSYKKKKRIKKIRVGWD